MSETLFKSFMSVSQFAKRERVTVQAVRKALKEKRILGQKVGKFWIVGAAERMGR